MDETLKNKYKKYKVYMADEWVFQVHSSGEYCRIDGIDDKTESIMVIAFDKRTAEMLLKLLKNYLKGVGYEKEVGYV